MSQAHSSRQQQTALAALQSLQPSCPPSLLMLALVSCLHMRTPVQNMDAAFHWAKRNWLATSMHSSEDNAMTMTLLHAGSSSHHRDTVCITPQAWWAANVITACHGLVFGRQICNSRHHDL